MRNSAVNSDNLANHASEAVRKRNSAIFASGAGDSSVKKKNAAEGLKTAFVAPHAKTERRMNKTEERFFAWLKEGYEDYNPELDLVIPQPTRIFRFGNGDTYTPDFLVVSGFSLKHISRITAWEVKCDGAHYNGWEQGFERYKRAKEQFSKYGIVFKMAIWQPKKLTWRIEE